MDLVVACHSLYLFIVFIVFEQIQYLVKPPGHSSPGQHQIMGSIGFLLAGKCHEEPHDLVHPVLQSPNVNAWVDCEVNFCAGNLDTYGDN